MSVTVEIPTLANKTARATVDSDEWSTGDPVLRDMLIGVNFERVKERGYIYSPWPDMDVANLAIELFGGKIISSNNAPDYVPGRVY